ncbi:hypothetical protein BC834DRAFT_196013 [Gloeopeniophorella convolvens]|nr:hypothetical protein BC834DRAFT_196013 [Gloeopeniophorella convolvens]
MSVDPGVSHYTNESEHHPPDPPPAFTPAEIEQPALPAPAPIHLADDTLQRGRMRVRRRSSADHLVFQRDPVALHNRGAPSPLSSFPPTTVPEEDGAPTPTSTQFVQSPTASSSSSSFPPAPVEPPALVHIQSHELPTHARTASLGEPAQPLSRSSSRRARANGGGDSPTGNGVKGHRPHLSLGSIFGRAHAAGPESPAGAPHEPDGRPESPGPRGRDKAGSKRHSFLPHYMLGRTGEAGGEDEHREVGDGWQEFRKGTYTFPISFEIPARMPASLECESGTVAWRLVAKVRRPGVFASKLTAARDVLVVAIPGEADVEATGDVLIERAWDDQLQYVLQISGKVFAIGGALSVNMSFMPLAKVQMYKLAVELEERVDSYISNMNMTRTVSFASPLLVLQNPDETKPLLPLDPDDPRALEHSPLAALHLPGAASDAAAQLLGPGPWPVRADLLLPADCTALHATSRNKESTVHVSHSLRFTMRLARGDDTQLDPRTGRRKLFEVVVRTPVHILSCFARAEYTALPRYSETMDERAGPAPAAPVCPCGAEREHPRAAYDRNMAYERLITGREGMLGEAPPAYDAAPPPPPPLPRLPGVAVS